MFDKTRPRLLTSLRKRWTEWVLAYVMVCLGVMFWVGDGVFNHAIYDNMEKVAPQKFWAVIMLSVGVVRMVALFLNGSFPVTYMVRIVTSIVSAMLWFQIFALYWSYQEFVPGVMLSQIPLFIEISNVVFASQERVTSGKSKSDAS